MTLLAKSYYNNACEFVSFVQNALVSLSWTRYTSQYTLCLETKLSIEVCYILETVKVTGIQ